MIETVEARGTVRRIPIYRSLYFQVVVGIVLGVAVGAVFPTVGESMKPLGDGFIKLIRMMIGPVIFCTVVTGIANIGDLKKLGRVGIKALLYFEVVTTLALLIGLAVVKIVQPGAGMNVNPATLDASAVQQYASSGKELHTVDFLLNIIPDTIMNAFAKGEILQILFIAVLFGIALAAFERGRMILQAFDFIAQWLFRVIAIIMRAAPLGAFGAMAFTIGKYGLRTLLPLGKLLACVYITCGLFVFVVLGLIARTHGFGIWSLLRYLREEFLLVLGTSSSETALPRLLMKLENLGCAKSVVGLVVPAGYSFNLDGTSIYLTIAALFVAQATNTHLTFKDEVTLLLVLMLTSKGSAAVTGGGFITLAATLSALGTVPVAGITLLLGVDRFMSEMRGLTNLAGNAVATIVVAKWEGEFEADRATEILDGAD
ncbi:MAG TPA: dicarboxylate/amino acid:cation symporter [Bryobacteraceae bacterium]|nr:dicarboxylate/amino acid:cation symporter [Bryobacteraceae bacterium]